MDLSNKDKHRENWAKWGDRNMCLNEGTYLRKRPKQR